MRYGSPWSMSLSEQQTLLLSPPKHPPAMNSSGLDQLLADLQDARLRVEHLCGSPDVMAQLEDETYLDRLLDSLQNTGRRLAALSTCAEGQPRDTTYFSNGAFRAA